MGSTVSNLSKKISKLNRGDEIIVLRGEGYLPVSKDTTLIVAFVDGGSAICHEGTVISENCISDLIITGRRFETYRVNAEAMLIWGNILAARKEAQDPEFQPDWSVPDPFPAEPE